jgi:hypothetical protein
MQKNVDALQKTMRALKQVTVGMEFQTESSVTSSRRVIQWRQKTTDIGQDRWGLPF